VSQELLEIRLLGPLEVRKEGRALPLGGSRPRALLALLCLSRGAVVSTDAIVDHLWGESPPSTARHMVAVYVSTLRKSLGSHVFVTRAPGYGLLLEPENLDTARFERLLVAGRQALADGASEPALAVLTEALGLWRGPALQDFAYEPFAQEAIVHFEELRLLAEEEQIEASLALGDAATLVPRLESLVAATPLRERRQAQLMLALYRSGRQAEALSAYQEARRVLLDELGLEPGSELRQLERSVLSQDERLLAIEPKPARGPLGEIEKRRPVTLVVVELADAGEGFDDPEAIRARRRPGLAQLQETVGRYDGTADELPDGSALAVFGSPLTHEDDVLRALRATEELRALGVISRAGIESGEALFERGVVQAGHPVRSAMQLRDIAGRGEIVLGAATRRLVAGAVTVEPIRGEPGNAWRLREVRHDAPARPLQLEAPLVGRDGELAILHNAYSQSVAERSAVLLTVYGEPGIGKSRLAHEFSELVGGEARVLFGRCPAYGEGISYWPLQDVLRHLRAHDRNTLRELLADDKDCAAIGDRIASLVGAAEIPYRVEEIRWASRRLFEALGRQRPLVLVLDDMHWADPTFLDLVRHVLETSRNVPIFLLCLARREFIEEQPEWERLAERASTLTLEALAVSEAEELVSGLDRAESLGPERRSSLIDAAEGNPLFLEQLVVFALERATSRGAELPPTLRSLLAARLDRLGPGERVVLECASVVGREFWAGAVSELLPPDGRATLGRHLAGLSRRELTEPGLSTLPFEDAFRFRHVLIQEAAYRSLSKARRAELHERLADSLQRTPAHEITAEDEVIGHHLEQAFLYREELGASDESIRVLGKRAEERLARAGRRALVRGNAPAAIDLLDRARRLRPRRSRTSDLSVSLAEALEQAGELESSYRLLEEAIEEARRCDDRRGEWLAALQHAHVGKRMAPQQWSTDRITETAESAMRVFEDLEDHVGLSRARLLAADVSFDKCRYDEAATHFRRAVEHARRAGAEREELLALNALHASLYFGTAHVDVAQAEAEALLARAGESPGLEARVLLTLAGLEAMTGAEDEARRLYFRAKSMAAELGLRHLLATAALFSEEVGVLFGDLELAGRELRSGYEQLDTIGEKGVRSTVAVLLADVLYRLGRRREAEEFVDVGLAIGSPEDIATQSRGRAIKAKILAARKDDRIAERLAGEAVALSTTTDDLFMHSRVLLDQAEVLALLGRADEAIPVLEAVIEASDRKGIVVIRELAREWLAELVESAGDRVID
jgi:DNA-binding SARP family transcriptional activator